MITDARIAVLVLLVLFAGASIKWPKHAFRWHTGHTLDGYHYTNATWLRPATRVLHPTGNAHRWHKLPRIVRAFVRSGVTVFLLICSATFEFWPWPTLLALGVAAVVALILGVRWGWRKVRPWLS